MADDHIPVDPQESRDLTQQDDIAPQPDRATRRAVTIIDVAQRANVAVGTVSNVLNNTRRVSDERRKRVLKAIEELGFSQNLLAQGLRRQSSPIVGLCVPLTSTSYFAALVDSFEDAAAARGMAIMQVLTGLEPEKEYSRLRQLLNYRVGGILFVPSSRPDETFSMILEANVPVVLVDRPAEDYKFDQVTFANYDAMTEVATRLVGLGHRRILFVVQQKALNVTQQRLSALNAVAKGSVGGVKVRILEANQSEAIFSADVTEILRNPQDTPTAVIVSNSTLAAWFFRTIRCTGIRCPDEVSLVSFGEPEWSDLTQPMLSVVRQPTREIARIAWDFLIGRMTGEASEIQRAEIKGEVIFRDSVRAIEPH